MNALPPDLPLIRIASHLSHTLEISFVVQAPFYSLDGESNLEALRQGNRKLGLPIRRRFD